MLRPCIGAEIERNIWNDLNEPTDSKIYSNVEVLKIATSGNCELFAMSGERNPYKEARLGLLQEGAWADMLRVNGDPTTNIKSAPGL